MPSTDNKIVEGVLLFYLEQSCPTAFTLFQVSILIFCHKRGQIIVNIHLKFRSDNGKLYTNNDMVSLFVILCRPLAKILFRKVQIGLWALKEVVHIREAALSRT